MSELMLRRTPEEVQRYNRRFADSVGILRVLNLLSERDWFYTFTFTRDRITLLIQSDPKLTADDFRSLADGTIPEVLHAEELRFNDSRSWAVRCALSTKEPKNALELSPWSSPDSSGLQIIGFSGNVLPPTFQNASSVEQHLYELTWFGSHFRAAVYGARFLKWNLYGVVDTYRPRRRVQFVGTAEPLDTFECEVLDEDQHHIGSAALIASSHRSIASNRLYHSRLGVLSTAFSPKEWMSREHAAKTGVMLEIDEKSLNYETDGDIGPYDKWQSVRGALENAARDICKSPRFASFMDKIEQADRARSASALAARQEALRKRARVWYKGRELGCVPESENEVVVLLAKLEAVGGFPYRSLGFLNIRHAKG